MGGGGSVTGTTVAGSVTGTTVAGSVPGIAVAGGVTGGGFSAYRNNVLVH